MLSATAVKVVTRSYIDSGQQPQTATAVKVVTRSYIDSGQQPQTATAVKGLITLLHYAKNQISNCLTIWLYRVSARN